MAINKLGPRFTSIPAAASTTLTTVPTRQTDNGEQAAGAAGNFLQKYKTPLLIGGALLIAALIFMNRNKNK